MSIKSLNNYRITHKNGVTEDVSAPSLIEALNNLEVPEANSIVQQTYLTAEGVRTVVDESEEIPFTATANDETAGHIVTPASGIIHAGDEIALRAIPASEGYGFVEWQRNGERIATVSSILYKMTALSDGEVSAVFTAVFEKLPVAWESAVSPDTAGGAGCLAFPESGMVNAGDTLQLLAVAGTGYVFTEWQDVNGNVVGTDARLNVDDMQYSADGHKYTAVFTASE